MFDKTKDRLISRVGLTEKDLPKVKFWIVPSGFVKPKPIEDGGCCWFRWRFLPSVKIKITTFLLLEGDILADMDFGQYDYIGIDHVDKSGKSTRVGQVEKAIKIFVSVCSVMFVLLLTAFSALFFFLFQN
jgi:hypothetical protein